MTRPARSTAIAALLFSLTLPAWGQNYYLYEPKAIVPDAKEPVKDGVLVKEVPVREGDTLYGISRKFSRHGGYYPQILLFNDIKDPNLIYTGDTLRIPLPHGDVSDAPVTAVPLRSKAKKNAKTKKQSSPLPLRSPQKQSAATVDKKTVERTAELPLPEKSVDQLTPDPATLKADRSLSQTAAAGGQQLFEKAVKAYRQDDCRTALELFDRYLADYAASPMAADASLYKAECYLKLSAQ